MKRLVADRPLGRTGIMVTPISFGAGPVSGLMTGVDEQQQRAVIAQAIEFGINWFDTAATYGNGQSEISLGRALSELDPEHEIHLATKVRVNLRSESDLRPLVVESVKASLERLQRPCVTLLQIHNSITANRNSQPTSVTPEDVLGPKGLLEGMEEVKAAGWVKHFGLTGIGEADALRAVIKSGHFATIQAPFHLLNPSTLHAIPAKLGDPDYGQFLQSAAEMGMGIFAIRVYAAGALLGATPSAHTLKTPFFPLALYERDLARCERLKPLLTSNGPLGELALRYALSQPDVTSSILGFGSPSHVTEAVRIAQQPMLSQKELVMLESLRNSSID